MLPYHFYESAKAAFGQEIDRIKDRMALGHWKTEGEARKLVGEVAGLEKARALLAEEYAKIETLEDEELDE